MSKNKRNVVEVACFSLQGHELVSCERKILDEIGDCRPSRIGRPHGQVVAGDGAARLIHSFYSVVDGPAPYCMVITHPSTEMNHLMFLKAESITEAICIAGDVITILTPAMFIRISEVNRSQRLPHD